MYDKYSFVSFLGDVAREYAPLVAQAAQATGFRVYVGEAMGPLYDSVGVYTRQSEDHGPFWAEFNRLKAERHAV